MGASHISRADFQLRMAERSIYRGWWRVTKGNTQTE